MPQPTTGDINQQVTVMQLIVGALAIGLLVFGLITVLVFPGEPDEGPLTKIALIGGLGAVFLSGPVGRLLQAKAKNAANPLNAYQSALIVSAGLLEAGALLNLLAHMQEHSPWTLAMAALLWAALLAKMPTQGRVRSWLESEARNAND